MRRSLFIPAALPWHSVGFAEIERLDLNEGASSIGPTAEFPVATSPAKPRSRGALMA